MIQALLHSLFACNHAGTRVSEGKCYCPQCGSGLIYRWVVLRCRECNTRRESRYRFRRIVPAQRCCSLCGDTSVCLEYLENPDYYQLCRARLMVIAEEKPPFSLTGYASYLFGEPLGAYVADFFHSVRIWVDSAAQAPAQPALALIVTRKAP